MREFFRELRKRGPVGRKCGRKDCTAVLEREREDTFCSVECDRAEALLLAELEGSSGGTVVC